MIDDMGIFRTTVGVASLSDPQRRVDVERMMVDTGSEYTWIAEERLAHLGVTPVRIDRFETADGRILERHVGFAMLHAGGRSAPSVVVFAQPGDMVLLGAHGLEGLNLRVDLARKELVPAGPVPAAGARASSVGRLSNLEQRIDPRLLHGLHDASWPPDHDAVDCGPVAQPEVQHLARLSEVAPRRIDLPHHDRVAAP